MTKSSPSELVVVGFNYGSLAHEVAERARQGAEIIRRKIKHTISNIILIGNELLDIKIDLPHGEFGPWLQAEFGWTERTAQNYMAVAERFGPKSEMISDLQIQPTAAYLLAASSTPDQARQTAVERAAAGEPITVAIVKQILAETRQQDSKRKQRTSGAKLGVRLTKFLERVQEAWNPKELPELARQLRLFADGLEKSSSRKRSAQHSV